MVLSRARASSFRFAIRSPCLGESIGFFAINDRVFEPSGWRKFGFVNWNDPIAPRVSADRYSCGLLTSGRIQNNFNCRWARHGTHGKGGGIVKVAGYTTLVRYLATHLNVILIHEYADRDYLRYWPGAYCLSRCFGSLPGPVQALLVPIGQSAVDIAKRVSSERDQTFRCTVFHYMHTGVAFYSLVHSASWEFHGTISVYLYLSRVEIIKKSIIWYREYRQECITWCFAQTHKRTFIFIMFVSLLFSEVI